MAEEPANAQAADDSDSSDNAERPVGGHHRRAMLATEIILQFYLQVVSWYGQPKCTPEEEDEEEKTSDAGESDTNQTTDNGQSESESEEEEREHVSALNPVEPPSITDLIAEAPWTSSSSSKRSDSNSDRAFAMLRASSGSISDRSYVVRLEELSASEWKKVFAGLYRVLWMYGEREHRDAGAISGLKTMYRRESSGISSERQQIDPTIISNLCRITKRLVVYPSVHAMISEIQEPGHDSLFSRMAQHSYNAELASLLHGLIHLAQKRLHPLVPIFQSIVQRVTGPVSPLRSVSSASTASTSSITSTHSTYSPSPSWKSSIFYDEPFVYERVGWCASILRDTFAQHFPNTFRYYYRSRLHLASFEPVQEFEREIVPKRIPKDESILHEEIKEAALAAVLEKHETMTKLADLAMAEIFYLDAETQDQKASPTVLVIDILTECLNHCVKEEGAVDRVLPAIQSILDTLCGSISYEQHLSTISELANQERFSDSDSSSIDDEDIPVSPQEETSPPAVKPAVPTKQMLNQRPLTSCLLVIHVVELLRSIIRLSNDRIDTKLARLDLGPVLINLFTKFPTANILHCRLVQVILDVTDRSTSVNNPLLRSFFRPPSSILSFIMDRLQSKRRARPYDPHLTVLAIKIHKVCSSPTLPQELIVQYCKAVHGWRDLAASLVAAHYKHLNALDDWANSLRLINTEDDVTLYRRVSDDDDLFEINRRASSGCEFLPPDLEPFRRPSIEGDNISSWQNAVDTQHRQPSQENVWKSETNKTWSVADEIRKDPANQFEIKQESMSSGCVYQKDGEWKKVRLVFNQQTCEMEVREYHEMLSGTLGFKDVTSAASAAAKLKQFLLSKSASSILSPSIQRVVVCNVHEWISFGRDAKDPTVGAFGFQVEVFDKTKEMNETFTFVTRSEAMQKKWQQIMQQAIAQFRTGRHDSIETSEMTNVALIKSVATVHDGGQIKYRVIPEISLLSPVIASSFVLDSDVPEEIPFWGSYQGAQELRKYVSLFRQSFRVVACDAVSFHSSGYSVTVDFNATFEVHQSNQEEEKGRRKQVTCACTDTYLMSGDQIMSLTRTIGDCDKLVDVLCNDDDCTN